MTILQSYGGRYAPSIINALTNEKQANESSQQWRAQLAQNQYEFDKNYAAQQNAKKLQNEQWAQEMAAKNKQFQDDLEFKKYAAGLGADQWAQEFAARQDAADLAKKQWDKQFVYNAGRDQTADANWYKNYMESAKQFAEEMGFKKDEAERVADQWAKDFGLRENQVNMGELQSVISALVQLLGGLQQPGVKSEYGDDINGIIEKLMGMAQGD